MSIIRQAATTRPEDAVAGKGAAPVLAVAAHRRKVIAMLVANFEDKRTDAIIAQRGPEHRRPKCDGVIAEGAANRLRIAAHAN